MQWERYAWHSFHPQLALFLDKWVLEKLHAIYVLITWLVFQAHIHHCSLCHSAALWLFREHIGTRGVLGPATTRTFTFFDACTKLLQVWLRGRVHPSQGGHYLENCQPSCVSISSILKLKKEKDRFSFYSLVCFICL